MNTINFLNFVNNIIQWLLYLVIVGCVWGWLPGQPWSPPADWQWWMAARSWENHPNWRRKGGVCVCVGGGTWVDYSREIASQLRQNSIYTLYVIRIKMPGSQMSKFQTSWTVRALTDNCLQCYKPSPSISKSLCKGTREMAHPLYTNQSFYSQPQQLSCTVTWKMTPLTLSHPTYSASAVPYL